ncbi:MAG: ribonuclease D [Pseudomonadota bacterium]
MLITTNAALAELADRLGQSPEFGVDIEFERQSTYFPKLCLLQFATAQSAWCVDPLAPDLDLTVLRKPLCDPTIVKLFHSARQDLEVFWWLWEELPSPVFDTQIAAAFLGFDLQIGLTSLVKACLEIELPPSEARSDWRRRPLSSEQLAYAAADVAHLCALGTELRQRLNTAGRTAWHQAQCAELLAPDLYAPSLDSVWKRVKGSGRQNGLALGRLQALASWREQLARERDRPRQWILNDESLVTIAERNPSSVSSLQAIDGIPKKLIRASGAELVSVVQDVTDAPEIDSSSTRLGRAEREEAKKLLGSIRALAEASEIAPGLLATRREVERYVATRDREHLLRDWRHDLIADLLDPTGIEV